MKITPTKCKDGKRHSWKPTAYGFDSISIGHKWCRKCGSITQFSDGKRCYDYYTENGYYIEIPSLE